MENRDNQNQDQGSDISKSQSAQQPNSDRTDQTGEKGQAGFDQSKQSPEGGQAGFDQSGDTLAQQKQESETDSAESLDQRSEGDSGFVGTGGQDSSDELIDREKQSDGE
jgi:hypothetical protein